MTFNLKLVQDFSLQERALHEVAKACWGDFSIPIEDCIRNDVKRKILAEFAGFGDIKNHSKEVLSKFSETFSSNLPKTLREKIKNAVLRMQRGYREALACVEPFQCTHGLFMPNPLMAGPYSAKNFIDPSGYFDELAWAKCFVSDDKISVCSRFELACVFCFEETIRKLWSSMKNNGSSRYYSGGLNDINSKYGYAVAFWICQVENKFQELGYNVLGSFYLPSLKDACKAGHEYAIRFFWNGCTDREKASFLEYITGDIIDIAVITSSENPGILNFVYSLLPLEKSEFVYFLYKYFYKEILSVLLHSPFYKTFLSDILYSPVFMECLDYSHILWNLSREIEEIPLLEYKEMFLAIWKIFIQGKPNIQKYVDVLQKLITIKAEELIRKIIQPLSHEEKEYVLQNIACWFGKTFWHGDYDTLLRYLLLFLIDLDTKTQTFSVRADSIAYLDHVLEKHKLKEIDCLFTLYKYIKPASDTLEIRKVVECIKGSFEVLNYLLPLVEEMDSDETKS